MIFWRLLGWLFRRKPKALPAFEDVLLASYQKAKDQQRKAARMKEKERQKEREKNEKAERKRREEIAKLEAKGASPADLKRAFDHIGKLLANDAGMDIFIDGQDLGLNKDRFKAFQKPFVRLCENMGLAVKYDPHWIIITWKDALTYKERLEKGTTTSITTSAYR